MTKRTSNDAMGALAAQDHLHRPSRSNKASHRAVSALLEATDTCMVAACVIITVVAVPSAERAGDLSSGTTLFAVIGMVPLVAVAVCAWQLAAAIGRDETFTPANVHRLQAISAAFAISALMWLIGFALTLGHGRRLVLLGLGVAIVACVALTVSAAALALLTASAAKLKTDNDLVI